MSVMVEVEVRNVCKSFGRIVALRSVSFTAKERRIHGLVGHNGAGKTTAFRIILGLLRPDRGSVVINGHDITEKPEIAWRISGYVAEEEGYYDYLNAYEYLEFFAKAHGMSKPEAGRRISELLEKMDMKDYASRRIATYSKGMRRRLSLAHALLHDPELLVLDEPTAGLSPEVPSEVRDLITGLSEDELFGKTILISSHNLWELERICRDVTILHQGSVVFTGALDELKRAVGVRPRFRVEFDSPSEPEVVRDLQDPMGFKLLSLSGRECVIECDEQRILAIVSEFASRGMRILSLSEEKMTLDDIYVKLWGRLR